MGRRAWGKQIACKPRSGCREGFPGEHREDARVQKNTLLDIKN